MEIICPAWYPGAEKLIDAIPLLADQGVTAIEIGISYPNYFDHRETCELHNLMEKLNQSGVRVHSIHSPFGPECDISSLEDKVHEAGVDGLIDSIELASILGAENVIVHASDKLPGPANGRMDRARGVLREMATVATESGIIIAVENLPPNYLGHTPAEMVTLLGGISPDSIGICFDTGHANLSGRFDDFAEAMLPRSVTTHLHDNDGNEDQHGFPGTGSINWELFGAAYHKWGPDASIMLECVPPEGVGWSEAFQRLRTALGE